MKYFLDTEFLEGTQKDYVKKVLMFLVSLLSFGVAYACTKLVFNVPDLWRYLLVGFWTIYGILFFLVFRFAKTKNTIDLISIGIVSEDGREFYEVSKDFNLDEAWNRFQWKHTRVSDTNTLKFKEYWIRENVLKPIFDDFIKLERDLLIKQRMMIGHAPSINTKFSKRNFKRLLKRYGKSNKEISKLIAGNYNPTSFIKRKGQIGFDGLPIEFYAYYADYDWVVFCWLFGKMIELPKGFPMYCIDLKQILDEKIKSVFIDNGMGEDLKEGRLDWVKTLPHYPKNNNDHNVLSDAKWGFNFFNFLNKL